MSLLIYCSIFYYFCPTRGEKNLHLLLETYITLNNEATLFYREKYRNTSLHFTNRTYEPDNDHDEFAEYAEYTVPPSLSCAQDGETKQAVIK